MFKFAIFAVLLVSVVMALPQRDFHAVEKKCEEDHGVTKVELDALLPKLKAEEYDGVEEKYKCYSECSLRNLMPTDANGKVDFVAFARRNIPFVVPIVENCVAKYDAEEGKCERSFKTNACIAYAIANMNRRY